jgi:bHLH-MYC and R2R3-MYB transcription factors N-terminal
LRRFLIDFFPKTSQRCFPLDMIIGQHQQQGGCKFCGTPTTTSNSKPSIYVAPLSYHGLEQSIALRQESLQSLPNDANQDDNKQEQSDDTNNKKRSRGDSMHDDDEAVLNMEYIVYCQGRRQTTSSSSLDDELHRTGRWNDDEVQYVDQLVTLFDQGLLPISNNTKLSAFLGDMLLCKPSRLTKKMKNSKLSTRVFTLSKDIGGFQYLQKSTSAAAREECRMLSALQEQFVQSLTSLSAQLEMRFNLQKHWRNYFSNLCVELEYPQLEVSDFLASLEEQEVRASQAEAQIRNARRRKLGLGGTTTTSTSTSVPRPLSTVSLATSTTASSMELGKQRKPVSAASMKKDDEDEDVERDLNRIMNMGDFAESDDEDDFGDQSLIPKSMAIGEDFDSAMKFLMGPDNFNFFSGVSQQPLSDIKDWSTASNPFLAAISMYLEERNLPFQYVDCWVPSVGAKDGSADDEEGIRLLPAGFVTRDDQNAELTSALVAFGEYSKSFSFRPGRGLPGRVYISGECAWQTSLSETHPSVFARAGGAKVYGLRTAAAIPFSAPGVGRMVVVMYSTEHIPKDEGLTKLCADELAKFEPQPKWKLVIEIGAGQETQGSSANMEALNQASVNAGTSVTSTPHSVKTMFSQQQATGHIDSPPTSAYETASDEDIERRLISLLGDQMPAFHATQSGESSSSMASEMSELLPDIMRMRLLLLRPGSRRSSEENDVVDVLKSSFKNYSEESKRSDSEIAMLLAREWQCLQSLAPTSPSLPPNIALPPLAPCLEDTKLSVAVPTTNDGTYQSQVLELPFKFIAGQASASKALTRPNFAFTPPVCNSQSAAAASAAHNSTMDSYDHGSGSNFTNSSAMSMRNVSMGDQQQQHSAMLNGNGGRRV